MSLCVPTFAVDNHAEVAEEWGLSQAKAIANMDVSNADAEMQATILEAREQVILSESWVAEGVSGRILDKGGKVVEILQSFMNCFLQIGKCPYLLLNRKL